MSVEQLSHKTLLPQIYNLRVWVADTNTELLKQVGTNLLATAEFKVLNFVEHYFPVKGYTALWLLAESHLAIHTFPEGGYSYLELSGCNSEKTNEFYKLLQASGLQITQENSEYNGVAFTPAT